MGIGLRGKCPHGLKCWLYFPEDNCPFYRITVFSHYADENTPGPDKKLPTLCLVSSIHPLDCMALLCGAAACTAPQSTISIPSRSLQIHTRAMQPLKPVLQQSMTCSCCNAG